MPSTPHHHNGVIVGIDAIDQRPRGGTTIPVRHVDTPAAENPVRVHAGATGNTPPPADSARPPDNSMRVLPSRLTFPLSHSYTGALESPVGLKPPPATSTPAQPDVIGLVDEARIITAYEHGGSADGKTTDSPPGLKPYNSPGRHNQHNLVDEPGIPSAYERDGSANSGANRIINSGRDVEFGVSQNDSATAEEEAVRRWENQVAFAQLQQHVAMYHQRMKAALDVSTLRAEDREPALRKFLADQCLPTRELRIAMSENQAATTTPAMAAASVSTAPQDANTDTPPSHLGLFNNEDDAPAAKHPVHVHAPGMKPPPIDHPQPTSLDAFSRDVVATPNSPPGTKPPPIDPPEPTSLDAFRRDVVAAPNSPPRMKPPPVDPPQTTSLAAFSRDVVAEQAMFEGERRPPARTAPTPTINHLSCLANTRNSMAVGEANGVKISGRDFELGVYQRGEMGATVTAAEHQPLQVEDLRGNGGASDIAPLKNDLSDLRLETEESNRRLATQMAALSASVAEYQAEATETMKAANARSDTKEASLWTAFADHRTAMDKTASDAAQLAAEHQRRIDISMTTHHAATVKMIQDNYNSTMAAMLAMCQQQMSPPAHTAPSSGDIAASDPPVIPPNSTRVLPSRMPFTDAAKSQGSPTDAPTPTGIPSPGTVASRSAGKPVDVSAATPNNISITVGTAIGINTSGRDVDLGVYHNGENISNNKPPATTSSVPPTTIQNNIDSAREEPATQKGKLANTSSPPSDPGLLNRKEVKRRDFVTELAQEVAQQIRLELLTTSNPPSQRHNSNIIAHGRDFVALQVVMPSTPPTATTTTLPSAPPPPTIPWMPTNADSTTTIFGLGVKQPKANPPPATLTWLTLASFVDLASTMNTFSFAEALSWIKTAGITNADPIINTFSIVEALSWLMKATFANFDFATTTFSIVEALSWLMKANYNTFHHAQSPPSKGPHHLLHHTLGLFF